MEWLSGIAQWFAAAGEGFQREFYRNLIMDGRWLMILRGLGVTLEISFFSIIISTVLGSLLCLMNMSKFRPLQRIARGYINIMRGTPLITQLLLINFGIFASVNIDKVLVAVVAFSMNSAAYVSEILRSGILSVNAGQMEAGRSLGLSHWQTMKSVILPQAIKNALPTYTSEFIVLIKETAIVGYIAIEDLTKVGDVIRSRTYSAFFPLVTVALIYFTITTILARLFSRVERRLRESDQR